MFAVLGWQLNQLVDLLLDLVQSRKIQWRDGHGFKLLAYKSVLGRISLGSCLVFVGVLLLFFFHGSLVTILAAIQFRHESR